MILMSAVVAFKITLSRLTHRCCIAQTLSDCATFTPCWQKYSSAPNWQAGRRKNAQERNARALEGGTTRKCGEASVFRLAFRLGVAAGETVRVQPDALPRRAWSRAHTKAPITSDCGPETALNCE